MTKLTFPAMIAALLVVAIACGGGDGADGDDDAPFSISPQTGELAVDDYVAQIRAKESFKESERLDVEWYEDCLITSTNCLTHFWEGFEIHLSGCILCHDPGACTHQLDVIAKDRGWSIPEYEGFVGTLISDESYHEVQIGCLADVAADFCFALIRASMESQFDTCVDVWDEGYCLETLSVINARAANYIQEVEDADD